MDISQTPLVSVVIPAYNEASYITRTLSSIASQTYDNIEVVIVDDGSTDNTFAIAKEFIADSDIERAQVLQNRTNMGATFSKNRGAVEAKGDYVVFHDADDVSTPERFSAQVSFLQSNPDIGIVGTAVFYADEQASDWTVRVRPTDDQPLRETAARECPVNIGSAMFRAEALYETSLLSSETVEGYELVIEIAQRWKLANLSEPMYVYRINAGSRSKDDELLKKSVLVGRSYQAARRLNGNYLHVVLSLGWFLYMLVPKPMKRMIRSTFSPTDDRPLTQDQREAVEALL